MFEKKSTGLFDCGSDLRKLLLPFAEKHPVGEGKKDRFGAVKFQGGFGFSQELFGLIAGWEIALDSATIYLTQVGLPLHNPRGITFLSDFHTNPSHTRGPCALKTIHVHPRLFCHFVAFDGLAWPVVARVIRARRRPASGWLPE